MNERIEYRFKFIARFVFICLGIICILFGFAIDGIKFFGTSTTKGAFKPIKVGIYKSMMDFSQRYRWKIKYEFFIDGNKFVGCKFLRGGPDTIDYKREIGYLALYPKINWLESDFPKGVNFFLFFIIGQFFIWLAFRKKLIYESALSQFVGGIYYTNNRILPVKGLNPINYIRFILEELKIGFIRVFSLRLFFFFIYIFVFWYIILWGKTTENYNYIATIFSTITYAQAGVHGNFVNILGGLLGKTLMLSFFILPIIQINRETNYLSGYPQTQGSLYELVSNIGSLVIGFGIALSLFIFMTADLCREDSIIGLVLFFYCYKAQKNINNPIVGFLNSFVKGNPTNENAARISLLGASIGFLFSFILIWTSLKDYLNYSYSLYITILGLVVIVSSSLCRKKSEESL